MGGAPRRVFTTLPVARSSLLSLRSVSLLAAVLAPVGCSGAGVIDCGEGVYLGTGDAHYCEYAGVDPIAVACPAALPEVVVLDGSVRCAASAVDGGRLDAGRLDGGRLDSGRLDAAGLDASPMDAALDGSPSADDAGADARVEGDAGPGTELPEGCVLRPVGTPLVLSPPEAGAATGRAEIAWTGAQWMVTWATEDVSEIQVSRVSATGELLGSSYLGPVGVAGLSPGAVWTGTELGVAWIVSTSTVNLVTVAPDGTASVARPVVTASATQTDTPLTWTGSTYGLVWNERRGFDHITGRGLDASGAERWTSFMSVEADHYLLASVWTGTHHVTITAPESRGVDAAIWAVDDAGVITQRGAPLGVVVDPERDADAAWGGDEGVVVLSDYSAVLMRRLDSTGAPLGAAPLTVSSAGVTIGTPTVATDGPRWAVAFSATGGIDDLPLQFGVVDRAGRRVRTQIGFAEPFTGPTSPKIAPTGDGRYGVTWSAMGATVRHHYFQVIECVSP